MSLSEQEIIRREKLEKLRHLGIEPYPAAMYPVSNKVTDIISDYTEGKSIVVAGRLMSRRIQGKASFAELQDSTGRIQLYFNRDELCPNEDKTMYNEVYKKLLDIGDIVGIQGTLFTTQVGQKTINVHQVTLLSKSLHPLPLPKTDAEGQLYDEFNDAELRYRRRYVDLVVNPQVKNTFIKRTKTINSIRAYLDQQDYLEVETPILQNIPGGAAARPFITHHNALDIPLYLRIANELYLKRLIIGGFDGVYEFAKDFRNEGMDRTHNPEFTVMELYVAYKDYLWMMSFTELLLEKVATEVTGSPQIDYATEQIDFTPPYPRVPILEAIHTHTGVDISDMNEQDLHTLCQSLNIETNEQMGVGKLIDEIFGTACEHHYVQPTFIIDHPKEMSPLTKSHRENNRLTERFELIINGKEIANAYSELNDPIDQRERFEDQLKLSERGDNEAMFIDQDFLRALEYGMPPTSGIGIGIDRLVMLLTNHSSIQEVLFFPQMRPEKTLSELSDYEKTLINILSKYKNMPLQEIRQSVEMSNKSWDKTLKSLVKLGLIAIKVENNTKYMYLVE